MALSLHERSRNNYLGGAKGILCFPRRSNMNPGFDVSIRAIADDFYDAFHRCLEGKNVRVDEYHRICADIVSIPAIVNGSFALELYLKGMLSKGLRKRIKTHRIAKLYVLLKPDLQMAIRQSVESQLRPPFAFDSCLKGIDNSFEQWRYIYEKKDFGFGFNATLNVLPLFLETVRGFFKIDECKEQLDPSMFRR